MENSDYQSVLLESLSLFKHQKCWKVILGEGTGSVVNLGFGEKIRRIRPSINHTLSLEDRIYEAPLHIYIKCAWRLTKQNQIISSWRDCANIERLRSELLSEIVNLQLKDFIIRSPARDLSLFFENEVVVDVFCDHTNSDEAQDNYVVFVPQKTVVVGLKGLITIE